MDEPRKQPPPSNIPTETNPLQEPAPQPPPPAPPNPQPPQPKLIRPQSFAPEQKRTYLDRGEVRTMEKDSVRIREEEARKEQQRITELKAHRETEKERTAVERIRASALATKQQEETQKREDLKKIQDSILPPGEERRIRNLPSPPSKGKKIFVRLIVVIFFAFIALNLVLFTAWYFFFRNQAVSFEFPQIPFISQFLPQSEPPPAPSPQPTPSPAPTPPPQAPTNAIRNAINPVHTTTLQFATASDLSALLAQFLQAEQQPDFTQLRFRKTADNELVANGAEFFSIFGIDLPETTTPHFAGDSFFFSYSYARGNRFGMIIETPSPNEAKATLEQWTPQMEQTISPTLSFWAPQKTTAYTKAWRSSAQGGVEIRFQTFSLQDYGIVYALFDNYVIFASSFEATRAAIEALQSASQGSIRPTTFAALQDSNTFKPPPSLSFEQALGQILMIGIEDATLTQELQDTMRRLSPGGVLLLSKNIQNIEQLKQLTYDLQRIALEYSSLPLFIAVDQEGGAISRIEFGKEKTAQSTIEDIEQAYKVGELRAEELKFLGINLNLSPVLDSTKPSDFLFERTFQAGRLQTGQLARALLQGQKESGILSTLKHFPGYGGIAFNPEKKLAAVQEFPDISPFVFALPAKPEFLLLSNVIYANLDPDRPFPFSPKGITLGRSDLNFQGIILSDDLSQPSLLDNYSFEFIVTSPVKAGVTMIMFSKEPYAQKAYQTLLDLAQQDPFLKRSIEDSAKKILQLKKEFFFTSKPAVPLEHLSQQ
ncbi:MAG: glycoside hydrolase family 3 N-terminal domain-containing protein [Patescibacteria group bacterium]